MNSLVELKASPPRHLHTIRVSGVVQGVGFRPFIYRLATGFGLAGWVLNDTEGVLIAVEGDPERLAAFVAAIGSEAPLLSKITRIAVLERTEQRDAMYDRFDIRASASAGATNAVVPADSHVCAQCLDELLDPHDRRYRYPFINCTNCGPRFSLIRQLPYDRKHTTMSAFAMCAACLREYTDPSNRRYHAQPNACADCGPQVALSTPDGVAAHGDRAVTLAVEALLAGQVVAVKSVGGFHLAVNAADDGAVARLRQRKKRDAKPFAIMVDSVARAQRYAVCLPHEAQLLASAPRPIVLLRKIASALPDRIAPNNPNLGVMLASAPLHYLLLADARMPVLVMTSGNVSGYPIAFRNDTALAQLFAVADLVLHHDRDIETRVDDSVLRCSTHPQLDQPLVSFIRRSRGYAPYPLELKAALGNIVAFGAELKTTVALANRHQVYISQHIGDLKNDETFQSHQDCARHLGQLYDLRPDWIACDMHPGFRATRFAQAQDNARIIRVQHHHAHMAACMAENHLEGQTIGVIFDGAGYGPDNTIWGGEFLSGDYLAFRRRAHLRRLHLLGGDKAVQQPLRLALALAVDALGETSALLGAIPALAALDAQQRQVFGTMLRKRISAPATSSMGRLFDGVAALLGICAHPEYEAQGPIEMEALLERDLTLAAPYAFGVDARGDVLEIDHRPLIGAVVADLLEGRPLPAISRRFHSTIVAIVMALCQRIGQATGIDQVVLSGGVFLNEFLLVNCMVGLRERGFAVHCHRMVPTNDGGIALGQIMVANAQLSNA